MKKGELKVSFGKPIEVNKKTKDKGEEKALTVDLMNKTRDAILELEKKSKLP